MQPAKIRPRCRAPRILAIVDQVSCVPRSLVVALYGEQRRTPVKGYQFRCTSSIETENVRLAANLQVNSADNDTPKKCVL